MISSHTTGIILPPAFHKHWPSASYLTTVCMYICIDEGILAEHLCLHIDIEANSGGRLLEKLQDKTGSES